MKFQFVASTQWLEKKTCSSIIMQKMMLKYYEPIVKREVELSQAKRSDTVLCVGGGYHPCTAILFHQLTGATVTVIDNDEEAAAFSRKLIKSLGLADNIFVKHTNGTSVGAQHFDIIHIAMQISPKDAVFSHVHETMSNGAQILVREPKSHLACGYQSLEQIRHTIASVHQPSFSNIGKTYLYVK